MSNQSTQTYIEESFRFTLDVDNFNSDNVAFEISSEIELLSGVNKSVVTDSVYKDLQIINSVNVQKILYFNEKTYGINTSTFKIYGSGKVFIDASKYSTVYLEISDLLTDDIYIDFEITNDTSVFQYGILIIDKGEFQHSFFYKFRDTYTKIDKNVEVLHFSHNVSNSFFQLNTSVGDKGNAGKKFSLDEFTLEQKQNLISFEQNKLQHMPDFHDTLTFIEYPHITKVIDNIVELNFLKYKNFDVELVSNTIFELTYTYSNGTIVITNKNNISISCLLQFNENIATNSGILVCNSGINVFSYHAFPRMFNTDYLYIYRL